MTRHISRRTLSVVVFTATVLYGWSSRGAEEDPVAREPSQVRDIAAANPALEVPVLRPEVLAEVPHDPAAFTQGLELHDGTLYEGTGLEDQSRLQELDPANGAVRRAVPLPGQLFGEGITVVGDRIWQLIWRNGVVLEWDRDTLTLRRQLPLDGEGWGLCYDGADWCAATAPTGCSSTIWSHSPRSAASR